MLETLNKISDNLLVMYDFLSLLNKHTSKDNEYKEHINSALKEIYLFHVSTSNLKDEIDKIKVYYPEYNQSYLKMKVSIIEIMDFDNTFYIYSRQTLSILENLMQSLEDRIYG